MVEVECSSKLLGSHPSEGEIYGNSCSTDGRITDVKLKTQLSETPCELYDYDADYDAGNFIFHGSNLQVTNGCSGIFNVTIQGVNVY